jgi:hypothetical protein
MRRIIGILFVLMLAASVGATGGYGGLYVNNRVPGSDLLRAAEKSKCIYIAPGEDPEAAYAKAETLSPTRASQVDLVFLAGTHSFNSYMLIADTPWINLYGQPGAVISVTDVEDIYGTTFAACTIGDDGNGKVALTREGGFTGVDSATDAVYLTNADGTVPDIYNSNALTSLFRITGTVENGIVIDCDYSSAASDIVCRLVRRGLIEVQTPFIKIKGLTFHENLAGYANSSYGYVTLPLVSLLSINIPGYSCNVENDSTVYSLSGFSPSISNFREHVYSGSTKPIPIQGNDNATNLDIYLTSTNYTGWISGEYQTGSKLFTLISDEPAIVLDLVEAGAAGLANQTGATAWISTADNVYQNLRFELTHSDNGYSCYGAYAWSHVGGVWRDIYADTHFMHTTRNIQVKPYVSGVYGGKKVFGDDSLGGWFDGRFENCRFGEESAPGCGNWSKPTRAEYLNCSFGGFSAGIGAECAAKFSNCVFTNWGPAAGGRNNPISAVSTGTQAEDVDGKTRIYFEASTINTSAIRQMEPGKLVYVSGTDITDGHYTINAIIYGATIAIELTTSASPSAPSGVAMEYHLGHFTGTANNVTVGSPSVNAEYCFGNDKYGLCTGTLENVTLYGIDRPINARSATFRNCTIISKSGAADGSCINVLPPLVGGKETVIIGCTLIADGAEDAIDAAAAVNAVIANCRMNNGIDVNITNLIDTPNNTVDADLKQ